MIFGWPKYHRSTLKNLPNCADAELPLARDLLQNCARDLLYGLLKKLAVLDWSYFLLINSSSEIGTNRSTGIWNVFPTGLASTSVSLARFVALLVRILFGESKAPGTSSIRLWYALCSWLSNISPRTRLRKATCKACAKASRSRWPVRHMHRQESTTALRVGTAASRRNCSSS